MSDVQRFKDGLLKKIRREVREEMGWQETMPALMVTVADDLTLEELDLNERRRVAWKALCEKGERDGWLEWTNEYPGSHLVTVTPTKSHTRTKKVPETKAQTNERRMALDRRIKDEVDRRFNKEWTA